MCTCSKFTKRLLIHSTVMITLSGIINTLLPQIGEKKGFKKMSNIMNICIHSHKYLVQDCRVTYSRIDGTYSTDMLGQSGCTRTWTAIFPHLDRGPASILQYCKLDDVDAM